MSLRRDRQDERRPFAGHEGGHAAGRRQRQCPGRRPLHEITVLGGNQLGRFGNAAEEANAGAGNPIIPSLAPNGSP